MNEETPLEELSNEPNEPIVEEGLSSETPEVKEEGSEETPKVEDEEKERKSRTSYRVEKLNEKFRQEERARKALEEENAKLKELTKIKNEPDPDDYADNNAYQKDKQLYTDQQIEERVQQRIREEQETVRQQEANRQINKQTEKYVVSRAEAVKDDPKYKDYESNVDAVVKTYDAPQIHNAILRGGGTEMVKYFGKHPEELEDIALMSAEERLFELGQIAAKVKAKTPKKISSAPTPTRSEKASAQTTRTKAVSGTSYRKGETKAEKYARINGR